MPSFSQFWPPAITPGGTYHTTIPYGASNINIVCWGAGGCGGRAASHGFAGGGGGGGCGVSYYDSYSPVELTIVCGVGGNSTSGSANGGDSYVTSGKSNVCRGSGGKGNAVYGGTSGASGGGALGNTSTYTGGKGANASSSAHYSGGGGGAASLTGNGAAGSSTSGGKSGGKYGGYGGDGVTSNGPGNDAPVPPATGGGYGGGGGGALEDGVSTDGYPGGIGAYGGVWISYDYMGDNILMNEVTSFSRRRVTPV